MTRMTNQELKEMIKRAISNQTDIYLELKEQTNPQVKAMADRTKGQKDALSDVLCAMNGNPVFLKMLTNTK